MPPDVQPKDTCERGAPGGSAKNTVRPIVFRRLSWQVQEEKGLQPLKPLNGCSLFLVFLFLSLFLFPSPVCFSIDTAVS